MKIELLELLAEIEDFVSQNKEANEIFLPFPYAKKYDSLMSSLTESEVLFLAVAAKGNQSILQMLWRFADAPTGTYMRSIDEAAVENDAFSLMMLDGHGNNIISQYETHYIALKIRQTQ